MFRSQWVRPARRLVASGAAVTFAASLTVTAAASADGAYAGASCDRAPSTVSGFVGNGSDPLEGVSVELYLDPKLSGLTVGESASAVELGTATTGDDGCFKIAASGDWEDLAEDGVVNIRALIHRPDQLEMRLIPLAVSEGDSGETSVFAVDQTSPSTVQRVDTDSGVFETFTGSETAPVPQAEAAVGHSASGFSRVARAQATTPASLFVDDAAVARASGGLRWTKVNDFGKRPVLVGQWWSTTPAVTQKWVYSKGASSSLEAAVSLAGEGGEYKHSETLTKASSAAVGFPKVNGKAGKYYRTYFKYGRFKAEEYDYISGKWVFIGYWVRRTHWVHGQQVTSGVPVPSTKPKNCSPYLAGGDDTTATSTAMTWTDGVALSGTMEGILGSVTLSSRTGFTKNATNSVHFKKRGRLCGVFGDLHKPGAVVARPPR